MPRTIKAKVSATNVLASPKEHDTPPHAILCTSNTLDEAAMYVRERGKVCCRRLELAGVNTPDKKRGLVIFWIIFILVAMLVAARAEVDSEARSIEVSYAGSARLRRSRSALPPPLAFSSVTPSSDLYPTATHNPFAPPLCVTLSSPRHQQLLFDGPMHDLNNGGLWSGEDETEQVARAAERALHKTALAKKRKHRVKRAARKARQRAAAGMPRAKTWAAMNKSERREHMRRKRSGESDEGESGRDADPMGELDSLTEQAAELFSLGGADISEMVDVVVEQAVTKKQKKEKERRKSALRKSKKKKKSKKSKKKKKKKEEPSTKQWGKMHKSERREHMRQKRLKKQGLGQAVRNKKQRKAVAKAQVLFVFVTY